MAQYLRTVGSVGGVALGMLNGLLPCGLVYLALISSVLYGEFSGMGQPALGRRPWVPYPP
jgi:sulfite exporter TauE/SafE